MQTAARDTVLMEIALREGLERGDLRLWYQPQMDVVSGAVVGVEALQHPEVAQHEQHHDLRRMPRRDCERSGAA